MASITDNVFIETRKESDPDVVVEITALLTQANHPNPQAWLEADTVKQAAAAAPKLQRFLVNRHWRLALGMCKESTTAERFCLLDEGKVEDYLKVFKEAILPVVVRHAL